MRIAASLVVLLSATAALADRVSELDEAVPELKEDKSNLVEFFRAFDHELENVEFMDCYDDHEDFLCPSDEKTACSGMDKVEAYCKELLGAAAAGETDTTRSGKNALEGCKNYVSWDDDYMNCCASDFCFEQDDEMEDDDDDDDDDDDAAAEEF